MAEREATCSFNCPQQASAICGKCGRSFCDDHASARTSGCSRCYPAARNISEEMRQQRRAALLQCELHRREREAQEERTEAKRVARERTKCAFCGRGESYRGASYHVTVTGVYFPESCTETARFGEHQRCAVCQRFFSDDDGTIEDVRTGKYAPGTHGEIRERWIRCREHGHQKPSKWLFWKADRPDMTFADDENS